ncbi:hypothetical protein [Roseomonas haemaphysalidis]|uniref:Uncharacterized protein n=1 Tax=Roseomonas haemaphysalidis TaxID=2768162 RepID=A0ABS3KWG7_9PROT|nr:hypothetical protein [Roseomonas haemaphysalidis]MBO1081825.1 hypothetical protein [Roseomonas haemaphysalidis]
MHHPVIRFEDTEHQSTQDWATAACPIPRPPRLDSIQRNAAGKTRMEMVEAFLGRQPEGREDADIRRDFCEAYSKAGGFLLRFDDISNQIIPLYFESRFDEWQGGEFAANQPGELRLDEASSP